MHANGKMEFYPVRYFKNTFMDISETLNYSLLLYLNFSFKSRVWTHLTKFWNCIYPILKGQSIIIPEEVVTVPKTFIFGPETILPNNGILLFDQTGKLGIVINFLSYLP